MDASRSPDTGLTLAERLGYRATDRLLIIHADDAGMCHSANAATIRAMEHGVVTCASVMVPCPWFPEFARYCREHPDADVGVHLTLTSEWREYRWRPVAPIGAVPGLLDGEGFLPRTRAEVVAQASPAEVEREIRQQILRARQFGIEPTHVDSHMGTLFTRPFYGVYTAVARELAVLPMLIDPADPTMLAGLRQRGIDDLVMATTPALKRQGLLFLDRLTMGERGDTLEERRANYERVLHHFPPGVTQIIVHLSLDDDEIRAITDTWQARWHEYLIFTDPRTKDLIDALGIHLIGYRELQRVFHVSSGR